MTPYLDPIQTTERPKQDFIRYLLTAYPLRDRTLRADFQQQLETCGHIWQTPYLEGSQPYRPDRTITELVDQGVLHPEMKQLFAPHRPLYQHQAAAIEAVITHQENIVVATGTGSGKTECFLIPMVDRLLKEDNELQQAGVRSLILYPMNALVNDQVKRLRQLLCRQSDDHPQMRFGFYTSRTARKKREAKQGLEDELRAYSDAELLNLFPEIEQAQLRSLLSETQREDVITRACERVQNVQSLSREEIQENPPHILVTNYSMLEHMLIRPVERQQIFQRSANTFNLLVIDEAHSYSGSTGTEVSMLIKRLKVAVAVPVATDPTSTLRCIATSASLGDRSADTKVIDFVQDLFGEPFAQVIRGDRVSAAERLGQPYRLPSEIQAEIYEYFAALQLPALTAPLEEWVNQLSWVVPLEVLQAAQTQVQPLIGSEQIHQLLWFALKQHPTIHHLIQILGRSPQPWEQVAQLAELWTCQLPLTVEGEVQPEATEILQQALSHLVQLGTLARLNSNDLPLLPVRLHLLFRSLEGLYACINPQCHGVKAKTGFDAQRRYGRLYLTEKTLCEDCQSPVLELASCRKCGQAYSLAHLGNHGELLSLPRSLETVDNRKSIHILTSGPLDSVTVDEEVEESEQPQTGVCLITWRHGWIGQVFEQAASKPATLPEQPQFSLIWHQPPQAKPAVEDGYLNRCPACNASRIHTSAIGRFISFTDAPLEVMLDSLFDLLPETNEPDKPTHRKLLTFSDGRQDAAFFASDFQRTHTEVLYRQVVWQAFQSAAQLASDRTPSIKQVEENIVRQFLEVSIPHPDRIAKKHHLSYVPEDELEDNRKNPKDCEENARKRARELLLREFGLPSARRFSIESLGMLTCHIEWQESFIELVTQRFNVTHPEARIFLTGLTDLIRLSGITNLENPSDYFPEVGGVEDVRLGILNSAGRIKKYLKFQKSPKDNRDAVSFCWYEAGNHQTIRSAFVHYCEKILDLRTREQPEQLKADLLWIYEKVLIASGVLTKFGKEGFQLNWELHNLQHTTEDWYQCNTCQQIFHLPGFSQLPDELTFQLKRCPAFKCEGSLQRWSDGKIPENHYRHLIQERQILPLRSQEHTAQLGTEELASRESRFRQGKINLLSCSTTLEMGVDIGELQAVALRNFPPHVSNYQQRVGRAGRRTDGVSVTLMYGQRRPHDRYYFEQPERLIAGQNQIPKLDATNFQVQERHMRAELLAEFLRQDQYGAENVTVAAFLGLPKDDPASAPEFSPPATAWISRFLLWLKSDRARTSAQFWLQRLGNGQPSPLPLLERFAEGMIESFQTPQLRDWNALAEVMHELKQRVIDPNEGKNLQALIRKISSTQSELNKIANRRLHDELARASILPIYGFPIDVVRLMTGESYGYGQAQGKHRLERDRRIALSEYAPGQEIVVDDCVHTSVGVLRPDKLEKKHYWVCQTCNHFVSDVQPVLFPQECPVCKTLHSPAAAKTKPYKIPQAFTTEWQQPPKVTPYSKPVRQPTSQVFLAQEGNHVESLSESQDFYHLTYSQGGRFFLSNQGPLKQGRGFKNRGFALCRLCGRDLSDDLRKLEAPQKSRRKKNQPPTNGQFHLIPHTHPISNRDCPGGYELTHLGHEFLSDFLKIRFGSDLEVLPPPLFEPVVHQADGREIISNVDSPTSPCNPNLGFWRSLTYALLAGAAQVIDVPRAELDGLFRPLNALDGTAEIILYDNVPGGAGYSRRIGEQFRQVLQRTYEIVESCDCGNSCYDCLRTYANQVFHDELDRHRVKHFLQPLVERLSPDQHLQAFAPDANTLSAMRLSADLPAHCRRASATSLIALPRFAEPFNLKRLEEIIGSLQLQESILELVVQHLPQPLTDAERVLRKRLQQWIEQGALKLYQNNLEIPLECCLSTAWNNSRIALKYQPASDQTSETWLKTTTQRGVEVVLKRLQQLRKQARLVSAQELSDPQTQVILPDPTWQHLTIAQLQQRLGLEQVLLGRQVQKIEYSDRYLKDAGAAILAELLQGEWLTPTTQMTVRFQQTSEDARLTHFREKVAIERAIQQRLQVQLKVNMRSHRQQREAPLPHRRELLLQCHNAQVRVLFDKGLDFLKPQAHQTYSVVESTYVVIDVS